MQNKDNSTLGEGIAETIRFILKEYVNMNSRLDPEYSNKKSREMSVALERLRRLVEDVIGSDIGLDGLTVQSTRPIGNWPEIPSISVAVPSLFGSGIEERPDLDDMYVSIRFIVQTQEVLLGFYPNEKAWILKYSKEWTERLMHMREVHSELLNDLVLEGFAIPVDVYRGNTGFRPYNALSSEKNCLIIKKWGGADLDPEELLSDLNKMIYLYINIYNLVFEGKERGHAEPKDRSGEIVEIQNPIDRRVLPTWNEWPPLIKRIKITKFLSQFNYDIDFGDEERFSIIHGPNGYGKTTLFGLAVALHERRPDAFHLVPFSEFEVTYSDGSRISVMKENGRIRFSCLAKDGSVMAFDEQEELSKDEKSLLLRLKTFEPYVNFEYIEKEDSYGVVSYFELDGMGKTMAITDLRRLFVDKITIDKTRHSDRVPLPIDIIPIHWVGTDRLGLKLPANNLFDIEEYFSEPVTLSTLSQRIKLRSRYGRNPESPIPNAIDVDTCVQHIIGLTNRYNHVDFNHEEREDPYLSIQRVMEIIKTYEKGNRDSAINSLVEWPNDHLPYKTDYHDEWNSRIRESQLDGLRRLMFELFDDLRAYHRLRSLIKTINSMFLNKRMVLTESGASFVIDDTQESLEFDALSSGEKNLLMIFYHLILGQELQDGGSIRGSVFIIDEPEISLHVIWQQMLVNNIMKIMKGTNSQIIILTHSPQIVHDRSDLLIPIGR